jgi:multisubunit Na+/H+ antiporter MnhG subunit
VLQSGPALQAVLIGVLSTITTPISLIVLIAAARQRDGLDDSGSG